MISVEALASRDPGERLRSSIGPGVEQRNAHRLEVADVARDYDQAVNERGRRNQAVALRTRIGHMQRRATAATGTIRL